LRYNDPVLGKLFLLFTILPALELWLLIAIGERIGAPATIAMLILTGVVGAALARAEGTRVVRAWQQALAAGTVPPDGVVSGVMVLLGGALLISPGVISDAAGVLLLVPYTRRLIARIVTARVQRAIERGTIGVVHSQRAAGGPFVYGHGRGAHGGREVIDVEAEVVEARQIAPETRDAPDAPGPEAKPDRTAS
jgi:UPF0716 protein FxsA